MYELTTVQVPFKGDNAFSVIVQHIKDAPPPSTINAHIPLAIEEIILKTLQKQPADRYQTAGENRIILSGKSVVR